MNRFHSSLAAKILLIILVTLAIPLRSGAAPSRPASQGCSQATAAEADTAGREGAAPLQAVGGTSFAWGGDLGVGIDVGGHDMSDINLNSYFGISNRFFQLLGIGAGIDMVMSNDGRFFPVYAISQSSFGYKNALAFGDLRVGCAFNNVGNGFHQTSFYVSPGVGFHLATGANYRSYLIVSYVFNGLDYTSTTERIRGLHYAKVCIGITF